MVVNLNSFQSIEELVEIILEKEKKEELIQKYLAELYERMYQGIK